MENSPSQPADPSSDPYKRDPRRRFSVPDKFSANPWRENHGNLLVGFTVLVCLVGSSIIACRQTRFIPPAFPTNINLPLNLPAEAEVITATGEKKTVFRVPLKIIGAASDDGVMKIALYKSTEGFNEIEKAYAIDTWKIVDGVCGGVWEIPTELKNAAFAAYHDENENGELDRNVIGIPKERYGYSNNARGLTGPPSFEEAAIPVSIEPILISIR